MQECRDDRLLDLADLEPHRIRLHAAGDVEFALDDAGPLRGLPIVDNRVGDEHAGPRAASDRPACLGELRKTAGPTSGHSSHFSASRRASAKVRRTPRVFWNRSIVVHLV